MSLLLTATSVIIPGRCSLCPVKNRGSFVKGVDHKLPLFSMGYQHL